MQPHWDIFCRVIDNYGDIGVCWRLARQLRAEYGLAVRLWVDEPATLKSLCPGFDPGHPCQTIDGVEVRHWTAPFPAAEAADVVIEAFACDLPAGYLQAMAGRPRKPRWINLEYLSAEDWVEDCHGMASPHPSLPLTKHFFFPGFTPRTGGLLREKGLLERRDAFISTLPARDAVEVSLFCYDTAPVGELIDAWASGKQPIRCHVPPGKPLAAVQRHVGSGGPWRRGNLELLPTPFVAQADFDQLLWQCDINFVRGEDSFVRAQWAGKPFVWHIYPQQDDAHLTKLDAFLARYAASLPAAAANAVTGVFHAWNNGTGLGTAWHAFMAQRPTLERHSRHWAEALAQQNDLAANLVKFCDVKL
ncbi:MAG TPA: elongation factor P maturation arginine rhamnosyltransferase EarP [Rhodocyclaceae bacterium]|nr:elongation factor P maturation arginine rhamnosyltransferase EarP [Rhodocyclaceae bacterium]